MKLTKFFAVNFDGPYDNAEADAAWLCAGNVKYCLEKTCTNTEFKVAEISQIDKAIVDEIENKDW